jgi:SNF2 family DNA or RNA helicase
VTTNGHTWGLLVYENSLKHLYRTKNVKNIDSKFWISLMKEDLISKIFTQYENYINNDTNSAIGYKISTTEDDDEIDKQYVPTNLYNILTNHQKHEVGWMFSWENNARLTMLTSCVPLLDTGFYYLPGNDTELITKTSLSNSSLPANCGILASETGSGKTISIIGLLSTDIVLNTGMPNLIVVTVNILYQWLEEFQKFCPELKILFIDDIKTWKKLDLKALANYHVVLTHRDVVCNQTFCKIQWCRIIFDEFHELINDAYYTQQFSKLSGCFKWGITGTLNDTDLTSTGKIFKILNFGKQFHSSYLLELTKLFYLNAIRRNPKPVLPKLTSNMCYITMSQMHKLIYNSENHATQTYELCSHLTDFWKQTTVCSEGNLIQNSINVIVKKRQQEINKLKDQLLVNKNADNFKNITQRIKTFESANDYFEEIIAILKAKKYECPICMEESNNLKDLVITDCMHAYCSTCFDIFNKGGMGLCITCKAPTTLQNIVVHPMLQQNPPTKIDKIIEAVNLVVGEKIIFFTQFDNLATHICKIFDKNAITYTVLQGVPSEINISLNKFKSDKNIKVLVMSIEQSASGINITEASHVFFAHPIFGYSHLDAKRQYTQCIGRAYRYGQKKNVNVKFFITLGTIEYTLSRHIKIE